MNILNLNQPDKNAPVDKIKIFCSYQNNQTLTGMTYLYRLKLYIGKAEFAVITELVQNNLYNLYSMAHQ